MDIVLKSQIEELMMGFPIYDYRFVKPEDLIFTTRAREICKNECQRYGTTWACPPAVGEVDECKEKCLTYDNALIFSTVTDASDAYDLPSILKKRREHEDVTQGMIQSMKKMGLSVMALSTESCDLCDRCGYLDNKPCCFPDLMHPCIESYGVIISPTLEELGMDYNIGEQTVLWFSILFFS